MRNLITIKIGGKKRTLKFNLNSDAIICEGLSMFLDRPITSDEFITFLAGQTEQVTNEKGQIVDLRIVPHENLTYRNRFIIWMFYSGLHNHLEAEGDRETLEKLNYHLVADWLEDVDPKDVEGVTTSFLRTRMLKEDKNNGQSRRGKGEKKNTPIGGTTGNKN